MKKVLIVLGSLSVAGTLVAFPTTSAAHGGDPHDMTKMMAAAMKHPLVVRGGPAASVTIVHVMRGCHTWSNGKAKAPGLKVLLRRGSRLTVLNQDLDMHRLVRMSGPRLTLGRALRMNQRVTVTFRKKGVYQLRTKQMEMPGMPEAKTSGRDNPLPVVVVVR